MSAILAIIKKVPTWVWVLLALLLAFLLLRGPLTRAWAQLKQLAMRDGGDYSQGATRPDEELDAMAQEAYAQLTAGVVNPTARERALAAILEGTNDTELRVVAKSYKLLSRDKTLYQAVDSAWMPLSDVDERLMSRLANIAMI
jgi:hypothetical protein